MLLLSIYAEHFQVTATAFSRRRGTSVGVAALVQRRFCFLDSVKGLEVAATTLRAEWEDVATLMRHEGNHHEGDRFRTL